MPALADALSGGLFHEVHGMSASERTTLGRAAARPAQRTWSRMMHSEGGGDDDTAERLELAYGPLRIDAMQVVEPLAAPPPGDLAPRVHHEGLLARAHESAPL